MILLSAIHFLAMPDIVVWQKSTSDIPLWLKSLFSKVYQYVDIIVNRIEAVLCVP